ncbi:hypothetical protein K3495_g6278 [Podosphaera aphanis]|nr:hypothetical protein K3495_g6278 [Podosphaera aphanis]
MRAKLIEAKLPIEFWDEAVEATNYERNHIDLGPLTKSGKHQCVLQAWKELKSLIDISHIRIWGCVAYSHVNPKEQPAGARTDKAVARGRGVFMGYANNTDKQFRIYAPDRSYTIRVTHIDVDESRKGGSLDLKIRGSASGQGTPNTLHDRLPRGRPSHKLASVLNVPIPSSVPKTAIEEIEEKTVQTSSINAHKTRNFDQLISTNPIQTQFIQTELPSDAPENLILIQTTKENSDNIVKDDSEKLVTKDLEKSIKNFSEKSMKSVKDDLEKPIEEDSQKRVRATSILTLEYPTKQVSKSQSKQLLKYNPNKSLEI